MVKTVQNTLNPVQLHLLQMFAYTKSKRNLKELKEVLLNYYREKVDNEGDEIWKKKKLSTKKLEDFLKTHKRIPYK